MTLAPAQAPPNRDTDKSLSGYAVVPNGLLRDGRLSLTARMLYAVLDGRRAGNNRDRGIRVGLAVLAADLGVSDSTTRRAAAELEEAGWLERRRTGRTSSWRLANPIRTPRRMAALQRTLDDVAEGGRGGATVPPSIGQERSGSLTDSHRGTVASATPPQEGREGPGSAGSGPRSVTADGSDRSPVNGLQSITREDYNITEASSRSARPSGAHRDKASDAEAGKKSKSQPATADPVLAAYLREINAATGAELRPTRALRDLVRKIAARGIPADEAALTAAAWLAAKGSKIEAPAGFLAAVALPSLAEGASLEEEPAAPTPIPPAYRDLSAAPRCAHGAEAGRCALCRRHATAEPSAPARPNPQEERSQQAVVRDSWPAVLDALKASSRVAFMVFSDSQPSYVSQGTLAVNVEMASKARNAKASGHEERLSQAIREATGLDLRVETRYRDLTAAATGAPF